jgi:hypothetical protein
LSGQAPVLHITVFITKKIITAHARVMTLVSKVFDRIIVPVLSRTFFTAAAAVVTIPNVAVPNRTMPELFWNAYIRFSENFCAETCANSAAELDE